MLWVTPKLTLVPPPTLAIWGLGWQALLSVAGGSLALSGYYFSSPRKGRFSSLMEGKARTT